MRYGSYRQHLDAMMQRIAIEWQMPIEELYDVHIYTGVQAEAIRRLYIAGIFHDLMTRYPNAYVRSQFIASSQEEIHGSTSARP